MAKATADAAHVKLGAAQSVVASPPASCGWTSSGPEETVQVTITYELK